MPICQLCNGTGNEVDQRVVGIQMAEKRRQMGIHARAVALHLYRSPSYISDLERGRRTWTTDLQTKYLKALEELKR